MSDLVDVWTARSRFTSWLMAIFAASALLLAVVGIYGVMSYLAAQRTREFGIRLALGARPAGIVRVVMWQAAPRIALGLALGTAAAFAVTRWIETLLFGVSATSLSALIPILALGGVALLACVVPAVRASRVSPVEALRAE
jgi:ABC-type antimicrobial peptide transport system permease subunit